MNIFALAIYYMSGVAACIVWRWMEWLKTQQPGTPMGGFWRARMPNNVSSIIVALLLMGPYLKGVVGIALRAIVPVDIATKIPVMYMEAWAAPVAGFGITIAARVIVRKFTDRVGVDEKDE